MLELLVCSLLTIFPDFLYRRFAQGKRLGREITLYNVWFELRWGIVTCLMLTVALITLVFFFHPSSTNVSAVYRSIPVLPQTVGRVAEVFVQGSQRVTAGQPIFRLEDETQRAAVETARRQVAEVDANFALARADLAQAEARILEARAQLQQATDEYDTRSELNRRAPDTVARREVERLAVNVRARQASVAAAEASKAAVEARLNELLPAQQATARAALDRAQADLDKTVVRAGVAGRLEQFVLQVGDVVNPLARPAGVLLPEDQAQRRPLLAAGFGQIESQVLRPGMIAEAACASVPWRVIPMVVTQVQPFIASGQLRSSDMLIDVAQFRQPGTVLVIMEPLWPDGLNDVVPGSTCVANAYTSNHEEIMRPGTGTLRRFGLHAIDAVGMVHAILLRIQVALLPFNMLVLSGH